MQGTVTSQTQYFIFTPDFLFWYSEEGGAKLEPISKDAHSWFVLFGFINEPLLMVQTSTHGPAFMGKNVQIWCFILAPDYFTIFVFHFLPA